jgi:hypothetical protein
LIKLKRTLAQTLEMLEVAVENPLDTQAKISKLLQLGA